MAHYHQGPLQQTRTRHKQPDQQIHISEVVSYVVFSSIAAKVLNAPSYSADLFALVSLLRAFLLRGDDLDAYPSSDPMRRFWARAVTGLARVGESVPAIGIAL